MKKSNRENYKANKKAKKKSLTRLSGLMKGLIVYKEDMNEIDRLTEKYPDKFSFVALGAYA